MVAEYFPTWENVLTSLGYQVLKIQASEKLRKLLQGGTLSGSEWLPPNQGRRLNNLQDTFFVSVNTIILSDRYGEEVSIGIGKQC